MPQEGGTGWCVLPYRRRHVPSHRVSAPLSSPYLEASDSSLPDSPPQLDSKGDSHCTESKLQTPHMQHDLVARLLQLNYRLPYPVLF